MDVLYFVIHLSVDRYLCCFYFLATMIRCYEHRCTSFGADTFFILLDKYLGVELLGYMVTQLWQSL